MQLQAVVSAINEKRWVRARAHEALRSVPVHTERLTHTAMPGPHETASPRREKRHEPSEWNSSRWESPRPLPYRMSPAFLTEKSA